MCVYVGNAHSMGPPTHSPPPTPQTSPSLISSLKRHFFSLSFRVSPVFQSFNLPFLKFSHFQLYISHLRFWSPCPPSLFILYPCFISCNPISLTVFLFPFLYRYPSLYSCVYFTVSSYPSLSSVSFPIFCIPPYRLYPYMYPFISPFIPLPLHVSSCIHESHPVSRLNPCISPSLYPCILSLSHPVTPVSLCSLYPSL